MKCFFTEKNIDEVFLHFYYNLRFVLKMGWYSICL